MSTPINPWTTYYPNSWGLTASQVQMTNAALTQLAQRNVFGGVQAEKRTLLDEKKLAALMTAKPRVVTAKMPDGFIPGVSWRAWKAAAVNGEWRLFALGSTGAWEPKKAMRAVCNGSFDHPAPHMDCNCGIWSFQTLEKLVPALAPYEVAVLGQVSIWGRIIETENGFRSQFAYPKELWLVDNSLEQLGYTYGVPVRTIEP